MTSSSKARTGTIRRNISTSWSKDDLPSKGRTSPGGCQYPSGWLSNRSGAPAARSRPASADTAGPIAARVEVAHNPIQHHRIESLGAGSSPAPRRVVRARVAPPARRRSPPPLPGARRKTHERSPSGPGRGARGFDRAAPAAGPHRRRCRRAPAGGLARRARPLAGDRDRLPDLHLGRGPRSDRLRARGLRPRRSREARARPPAPRRGRRAGVVARPGRVSGAGQELRLVRAPALRRPARAAAEESWSAPRQFRVPGQPSTEEVAAALEVLRRWQTAGSAASPSPPPDRRPDARTLGGRAVEGAGISAIRGENPAPTGHQDGVEGITYSPDGHGVHGTQSVAGTANGAAVFGESSVPWGVGVRGEATLHGTALEHHGVWERPTPLPAQASLAKRCPPRE